MESIQWKVLSFKTYLRHVEKNYPSYIFCICEYRFAQIRLEYNIKQQMFFHGKIHYKIMKNNTFVN
jgi:hypothetical protein